LDEATSALDCSNQEAMYSNLKRPVLCWSLLSLLAPDQLQESICLGLRDGEADPAEANLKIRVNPRSLTLKESEI
jgi:hypothetical protein